MKESERFAADRPFADEFRAAYRGRQDPADALWWFDHPAEASPSGLISPGERREQLRRLAYSRHGGIDAETALSRLEEELAADRADTVAALIEVSLRHPSERVALPAIGEPGVSATVRLGPVDDPVAGSPKAKRSRRRASTLTASAVVLALGGGIALGMALDTPVHEPQHPAMLDVFSRSRVEADTPRDLGFGLALDSSTFYRLSESPVSVTGAVQLVYAVRDAQGSPCLVLIAGMPRVTTISCVPEADISRSGISAYLQDESMSYSAVWATDGSVSVSGVLLSGQIRER